MKWRALAWCLLVIGVVCLSQQPQAYWQSRDSAYNNPPSAGGGAYSGPGDVVASATSWWGLRAYNNAAATAGATTKPVVDVRGPTSGTSCTIFLKGTGTGGLDLTTSGAGGVGNQCASGATTFCTVTNTNCVVSKLYDQVGSNHLTQATTTAQPTLSLTGGISALPQITFASGTTYLSVAASWSTTVSQPFSISHLVNVGSAQSRDVFRTTGAGTITAYNQNPPNTNLYNPYAGTFINITASDGSYHAIQTTFNSSSSAAMVDGTDNTSINPGTNGFATAADTVILNDVTQGTSLNFSFEELGVWPTGFTSGNRTSMNTNQHSYWGF